MATLMNPAALQTSTAGGGLTRSNNVPIYLAVFLAYVLLLPPHFNLQIGDTTLPPYRFILIPSVLYMVFAASRGGIKFGFVDATIVLATFWVCLALFMTTDSAGAFKASVAQTTDIAVAYFFGRFTLRSLRDLRFFLILLAPGLALVGALMMAEAFLHRRIIYDLATAVTGRSFPFRMDARLGLFRAFGPFPHPILAGLFMSSFLPLFMLSGLRGWPKIAGVFASFCAFFSLSSAALLGLVVGLVFITYDWLSERIQNLSWRVFLFFSAMFVLVAELATSAGTFGLVMRFASLNSVSAYNRVLIWDHGTRSVANYPWFGIGYAEWDRPSYMSSSMDHFWLLMAVRFGIIPAVLIAVATILAVVLLMRSSIAGGNHTDRRFVRGVAISLAVFGIGIVSVALWQSAHIWFFMLIGLAVSVAHAQYARANLERAAAAIHQRSGPRPSAF